MTDLEKEKLLKDYEHCLALKRQYAQRSDDYFAKAVASIFFLNAGAAAALIGTSIERAYPAIICFVFGTIAAVIATLAGARFYAQAGELPSKKRGTIFFWATFVSVACLALGVSVAFNILIPQEVRNLTLGNLFQHVADKVSSYLK